MRNSATTRLDRLNTAGAAEARRLLDGLYGQADWLIDPVLAQRPFVSVAALKFALAEGLRMASTQTQQDLLQAWPAIDAPGARPAGATQAQQDRLRELAQAYHARFGFPFVLAACGPRGTGMTMDSILESVERRLENLPAFEFQEALRQVQRAAEVALGARLDDTPSEGNAIWDMQERLAQHSEPGYAEQGQLTVTYLSDAHRACAQRLSTWMHDCGFDEVAIDAVGNVVGRYHGAQAGQPSLLTGSHYDTVRNGGKYDGRLGIFVPMACVQRLHRAGRRLPFGIELLAFAEEEGQRYNATFIGSSALSGSFDARWLDQADADGITMREAMRHAGLCIDDIPRLRRDPSQYLGYVEVHIEQGPVLNARNLPLGVVTSINGSLRYAGEMRGTASHAGTTPMDIRQDAAAAMAEWMLYVERRAARDGDSVATVGILQVPNGSINVIPGLCQFSLDVRAPTDAQRDALAHDILEELQAVGARRGVRPAIREVMRAAAAPSAAPWQRLWEHAVAGLGLPVFRMPSGAGHDAMKLHEILPQAMLFVRGEHAGISHNPLESTTSDDMQLAIDAFGLLLDQLEQQTMPLASQESP